MKKVLILLVVLVFILTGCKENEGNISQSDLVLELKDELATITSYQETLLHEIAILREEIDTMAQDLEKKDQDIEELQMQIDELHHIRSAEFHTLYNELAETKRLYCNDEKVVIEKYLVESYNYETNHITVKDRNDKVMTIKVSDYCKVLVAGQQSIIYQSLEDGQDFIDAMVEDDVHKVELLMKNDVVEQIIMSGSSW